MNERASASLLAQYPAPADRIVSVGGAAIKILHALGQRKRIDAIDAISPQSSHAAKEKPNVGCFHL